MLLGNFVFIDRAVLHKCMLVPSLSAVNMLGASEIQMHLSEMDCVSCFLFLGSSRGRNTPCEDPTRTLEGVQTSSPGSGVLVGSVVQSYIPLPRILQTCSEEQKITRKSTERTV